MSTSLYDLTLHIAYMMLYMIVTPFLLDCFSIYNEETHWHKFSYAEGFPQEQVFR